MAKWFRVADALSPLFGCDVRVGDICNVPNDDRLWVPVLAMRRIDIFVGDRPFQLVGDEDGLGLMLDASHLVEASLQDDIIVAGTDRPFGMCVDESELTRPDGYTLLVARYEQATQLAIEDPDGQLLASKTFMGTPPVITAEHLIEYFMGEHDAENMVFELKRRD